MTDACVGRLDAAAPAGLAALASRAVVQPPGTVPQKADPLPALLGCLAMPWLQGLPSFDRPVHITPEQAGHDGFHPRLLLPRVIPDRQAPHLVHMRTAVVVVQDLYGGGQEGLNLVPDPRRPIAEHAPAPLVLGDQPGLLPSPQCLPYVISAAHRIPAQQRHDPLLLHQGEANALGLLPCPWPPCPCGPRVPAARGRLCGLRWTRRDTRALDRQPQDGPPRCAGGPLRHAAGHLGGRGTHLPYPPLVAQLPRHLVDGMIAPRQARQLCEPLLGRLTGDLHGQSGGGLGHVPWRAALRPWAGVIQGSASLLTVKTVAVGAGQRPLADPGVHPI